MQNAPHTQPHDPTPGGSDAEAVAAVLAANPDGYENDDLQLTGVIIFAVAFVAIMAGVMVSLYVAMLGWDKVTTMLDTGPKPLPYTLTPPEPRLQPEQGLHESLPYQDMAALRSYEETILASYGWVDPQHTVVRMPIETAKEYVIANGLQTTLPPVGAPGANMYYDKNSKQLYDPAATQNPLPQNMP
jgi:hypothetical protein